MGIFSNLFGSDPSRKNWSTIALNISKGLEDVRKTWFDMCVEILQEGSSLQDDDIWYEVVNIHLGGDGELAMKAYQLCSVSYFLPQYISPSEGRDFADLIYAQVCGTEMEQILDFVRRYDEVWDEGEKRLFQFASDVAKYITGQKAPLESLAIAAAVPRFTALNHIIVASCFGDENTVKKLESELNEN